MRILIVVLLAAVSVAAVVTAGAQPVIDDFETGTFHLVAQGGAFAGGYSSVSDPAHAISAFRHVLLYSNDGFGLPSYADLDAWTTVDDKLRLTFGPDGGTAVLTWEPLSPVDLTGSGQNDRIEVDFSAFTAGGSVRLTLLDGMGGFAFDWLNTSGGSRAFPFSNLGGVDLTQVTKITVGVISGVAWSAYDLRDVRVMRSHSARLKFDIPAEAVTGPPFPVPPLIFTATDNVPSDRIEIRLLNATKVASGAAARMALTGMDSGGDMESGFAGAVSAAWNEFGRPFEGTAFDLQVDVSAVSGVDPQPFLSGLPVITSTLTGFLLEFDVHLPSSPGQPLRTSKRQMPFDAFPGQALEFANVRVARSDPAIPPEPITGFRVTFDAVDTGDVDPGEPLFALNVTGDCRNEATSGAPNPDIVIANQTLRAWPAVTREGTELLLNRPADAAGRIDLFDARGMLLQSLDVPRGVNARFWDGRDSGGRTTAAGVYFARFTDGTTDLRTRVVRIR